MTRAHTATPRVAVVGAGFSGLAAAVRLLRAGVTSFTVYEKAPGLGGTWRDNTYPGAGCDIPSHLYSYSFAPYRDPRVRYPAQREILRYLEDVARAHGLEPHLRYGTEITHLRYDDPTRTWHLHDARGRVHHADAVITAVGQLHRPAVPDLPGARDYTGAAFHTARWDHDRPLDGAAVAVIGTGSSAAQVVPALAGRVRRLHVFQRSANWVMPKPGARFHPAHSALLRTLPGAHRTYRATLFQLSEALLLPAVRGNRFAAAVLRAKAERHLRTAVADPRLRDRLTPDFAFGCKRVVLSSDWYPTLQQEHVELVTDPIERLTPEGIRTTDGRHRPVDAVVYATGFRTTEFLTPMTVSGPGGRTLAEAFKAGPRTHLGIHVPGFPNLFLMYGPNTNLGHNSAVLALEAQASYIARCVALLARGRVRAELDVTDRAADAWQELVDTGSAGTVWAGPCTSWFKTADGSLTTNWPYRTRVYQRLTAAPSPALTLHDTGTGAGSGGGTGAGAATAAGDGRPAPSDHPVRQAPPARKDPR
ncbi:flavin-containing monooxygenase [Kitasatospora sp. NPDC056327]|uniref:flavin-containing monooxygenase n=1 Tax=Kitasatospora sp. NPDC056327 TaxID=3345785 RepID=UPI0035DFD4BC